jgi:hypothetical protein
MGDYILNRTCAEPIYGDLADAQRDLGQLLAALAQCDEGQPVLPAFRTHCDPWLLPLARTEPNARECSFAEVANSLYGTPAHDFASYFDALARMSPADADFDDEAVERFLTIEPEGPVKGREDRYDGVRRTPHDSVLCVVSSSIMASLPREPIWMFDELAFVAAGQDHSFDHLAHPDHAAAIQRRRTEGVRAELTAASFWALKHRAFPHLRFGADVERQIARFSADLLPLAFRRLAGLDTRAADWSRSPDSVFPDGTPAITGESAQTMDRYGDARRFHGDDGTIRTFEDHLWIDGLHRIHIIRHADTKTVEVGYIGRHLPTVNYRT